MRYFILTSWYPARYKSRAETQNIKGEETEKNIRQFSRSVESNSLQPHGLQHSRLPCPFSTPRVHSNSCPSSQWCHPTISSSVVPVSFCLHSFPVSGSFFFFFFFFNFILFFNFTVLYWFCHISTWIHHRYTRVPHPEPSSLLPPHTIPLGHDTGCLGLVHWDDPGSFLRSQFFQQVAKVLEFQLQHQSFQWIFRTDFLWDWLVGSPWSPGDSQESSPTPQFKSINS